MHPFLKLKSSLWVTCTLGRYRKEFLKYEASLGYIVKSRPSEATRKKKSRLNKIRLCLNHRELTCMSKTSDVLHSTAKERKRKGKKSHLQLYSPPESHLTKQKEPLWLSNLGASFQRPWSSPASVKNRVTRTQKKDSLLLTKNKGVSGPQVGCEYILLLLVPFCKWGYQDLKIK